MSYLRLASMHVLACRIGLRGLLARPRWKWRTQRTTASTAISLGENAYGRPTEPYPRAGRGGLIFFVAAGQCSKEHYDVLIKLRPDSL